MKSSQHDERQHKPIRNPLVTAATAATCDDDLLCIAFVAIARLTEVRA
jgi:hypothetical protein